MVDDKPLAQILKRAAGEPPEAVTQALIDAANENGGKDNVTVCVMRVKSMPPAVATVDADVPSNTAPALTDTSEAATDAGTPTSDTDAPASTDNGLSDSADVIEADTADTGGSALTDEVPPPARKRPSTALVAGIIGALTLIAAIVVAIALTNHGPSDDSPPPTPPPLAPVEPVAAVSILLPAAPSAELPPARVAYRIEGTTEWLTPSGTQMTLAPSRYEVQHTRMDYLPLTEHFDIANGQTNWTRAAEWRPSPTLQRLLDAEKAIAADDSAALGRLVQKNSAGILQSPEHRQRWKLVLAAGNAPQGTP